jgi:hypothetical protein
MKQKSSMLTAALILAVATALPAASLAGAGKTHESKAEVVSIDETAKTITLKDEKGESHTAPLLGKAVDEAKHLKAGDKVKATCQDNDKGEHEGVTALKKV